jgi:hypothetical protein
MSFGVIDLERIIREKRALQSALPVTPEAPRELHASKPGEIRLGLIVRLKIPKRGFAYAGETATVEEIDRDHDTFVVAFDRVRTLRLYGSDEGNAWERF